jgi:hypothetical protein
MINIVYSCNEIQFGNENHVPTIIWVDLENMLSERNQTQRPHVMIPFIWNIQNR